MDLRTELVSPASLALVLAGAGVLGFVLQTESLNPFRRPRGVLARRRLRRGNAILIGFVLAALVMRVLMPSMLSSQLALIAAALGSVAVTYALTMRPRRGASERSPRVHTPVATTHSMTPGATAAAPQVAPPPAPGPAPGPASGKALPAPSLATDMPEGSARPRDTAPEARATPPPQDTVRVPKFAITDLDMSIAEAMFDEADLTAGGFDPSDLPEDPEEETDTSRVSSGGGVCRYVARSSGRAVAGGIPGASSASSTPARPSVPSVPSVPSGAGEAGEAGGEEEADGEGTASAVLETELRRQIREQGEALERAELRRLELELRAREQEIALATLRAESDRFRRLAREALGKASEAVLAQRDLSLALERERLARKRLVHGRTEPPTDPATPATGTLRESASPA